MSYGLESALNYDFCVYNCGFWHQQTNKEGLVVVSSLRPPVAVMTTLGTSQGEVFAHTMSNAARRSFIKV